MGSSGGGDDSGAGMMAMMGQGTPMPGLPVAGKDSSIGDPREYGQFQSFLPDIKAEGQNDMATGLRPDMFQYKSPTGVTTPRDELAKAMAPAAAAPAGNANWAALRAMMSPQDLAIFRGQVSPEEFQAFMSAGAQPAEGGGAAPVDGGGALPMRVGYPWGQNGPDVSS